jgi:hypothetical protein
VLVDQGEELTYRHRADFAQGFEQPLDHPAEQFVGLEVQRRLRQPRVAAVEEICTEQLQPADRPVQQLLDEGLGGAACGQRVEVALDGDRGVGAIGPLSTRRA